MRDSERLEGEGILVRRESGDRERGIEKERGRGGGKERGGERGRKERVGEREKERN